MNRFEANPRTLRGDYAHQAGGQRKPALIINYLVFGTCSANIEVELMLLG